MNTYSLPPLLTSLLLIVMGIFVYWKNRKNDLNQIFFALSFTSSIWLFFYSMAYNSQDTQTAFFWFRIGYCGVVFIAVTVFHYTVQFLGIKKLKKLVFTNYLVGSICCILIWSSTYLVKGVHKYFWGYYPAAGHFHPFFLIFFIGLISLSFTLLTYSLLFQKKEIISFIPKITRAITRGQVKYFFLAIFIYNLASVDFFPNYGIEVYPFGYIPTFIFILIIGYTIIKYCLMDIRIFITRAGIFLVVYSLVFGLPFWLGYTLKGWLPPTLLAVLLASPAPFIYNYLRMQAERVLLKDQIRYQTALREISQAMLKVRDLWELLKTAFLRVVAALSPEFAGLYIVSKEESAYILKYNQAQSDYPLEKQIPTDSFLIKHLSQNKKSMLISESNSLNLPLETVAVPFFAQEGLFGFLLLGPKPKKTPYTESDLIIFDILSSQVSLAIENCLFWQEEKTRLAKEEQLKRMQAMDHFSASMAHEIDNPITAIGGQLRLIRLLLAEKFKEQIVPEDLAELTNYADTTVNNLERISKMIKAVREFSKQDTGEFTLLNTDEVVDFALNIVGPQIKYESVDFSKEIESDFTVRGNKIYLAEVLINLIVNGLHAVYKKPKWQGKIILKIKKRDKDKCLIEVTDNGYGIKKEMLEDIFLDFVTTKASTDGTGMGLARVRKIVELHKGKVWAESAGEDKGASFFVELSLADKL